AKLVAHRAPKKSRAPADQKQSEEQPAIEPNVALGRGNAGAWQKVTQRWHEDERIDKGVHAVQRPSAPRCPEAAYLVSGQRGRRGVGRSACSVAGKTGHWRS